MVGSAGRSSDVAQKEHRRAGDMKQQIVDAIIHSRVRTKTLGKASQTRKFLQQYFADVPVEDLRGRSPKTMARAALDHLEFGARRRRGQALLRLFNPTEKEHGYSSAYTFIEMINDDMPFLVDSVAAAVNRHGHGLQLLIHPRLGAKRSSSGQLQELFPLRGNGEHSAESFIYIEISKDTDSSVLDILRGTL